MIPCFHGDVVLTLCGPGFQCFAVGKNINPLLCCFYHLKAFVDGEADGRDARDDQHQGEGADVAEGGVNIFELIEHG